MKSLGLGMSNLEKPLVLLWNSSCTAKKIQRGEVYIKDRLECPGQVSDCPMPGTGWASAIVNIGVRDLSKVN